MHGETEEALPVLMHGNVFACMSDLSAACMANLVGP